jgi:outer membrane biosynthesis protein TonB
VAASKGNSTSGHGVTRKARPCREIKPDFPYALLERKASVQVHLVLEIDEYGRVVSVRCTDPEDFEPAAVRAAISAYRDQRFDPALEDGHPVASMYRYRVDFNYNSR